MRWQNMEEGIMINSAGYVLSRDKVFYFSKDDACLVG